MRRGIIKEKPNFEVEYKQHHLKKRTIKRIVDKKTLIETVELINKKNTDIEYDLEKIEIPKNKKFTNKIKSNSDYEYEGLKLLTKGILKPKEKIKGLLVLTLEENIKNKIPIRFNKEGGKNAKYKDILYE